MIPENPVALYAEFTALHGKEGHVAQLISDYAAIVRNEPGNIVFSVYRRADRPAEFLVFEIYRDGAAFDAHLASEAGRSFNEELSEHVLNGGSTLHFLDPVVASGGAE